MMSGGPTTVMHVDTERGWRGGERQILWLSQALRAEGFRSIIAAPPGEPLSLRAAEAGFAVVPCPRRFEYDPLAIRSLSAAIRDHKAAVVNTHAAHATALAAVATLGTSARFVITRRTHHVPRGGRLSLWKYRRAHGLIAISAAVADVLVQFGIARSRIAIVPSGIDLTRRPEPASRERVAGCGVPDGAPLIVMVAALVPHKDPLTFVRAVATARHRVPALHALLVGDGRLRAEVERVRDELGVGNVLHLTGYQTDAEALLAAADVAVLSSREEGLGTTLLDALAFGRPVAATAAPAIAEVIRHGEHGLLAPVGDADALGEAIARLVLDRALAAKLTAAGFARARDFDIVQTARRTAEVYRQLLDDQLKRSS